MQLENTMLKKGKHDFEKIREELFNLKNQNKYLEQKLKLLMSSRGRHKARSLAASEGSDLSLNLSNSSSDHKENCYHEMIIKTA
jgi:hypothetical protein